MSGTVVELNVADNQFVRKGDLLFKMDPGTYENRVTEATGALAEAQAKASYLDSDALRKAGLSDLAISAQAKQDAVGIARNANERSPR